MDDVNVPVFAQAKLEYTKQLVDLLYSHFNDGITSIYDESKVIYSNRTGTPVLIIFRSLLEKVPLWNSEIIDTETDRIMKSSKCDWLDDLITAVFISHTRILMSIGPNQSFKKINVTIPKTTSFVHKTYINISREFWKNPYLFNENVPGHEYQRNMKLVEDMIKLGIEDTIRRELPVKDILREHLDTYDNNDKVDIQMIMNELKKSQELNKALQRGDSIVNDKEEEKEEGLEKDSDNKGSEIFDEPHSPRELPEITELPNVFKEDVDDDVNAEVNNENNENEVNNENIGEEMKYDNVNIVDEKEDKEDKEYKFVDPYNDPNDPSLDDIKKNTQDIVLNDITMPVVEEPVVEEPTVKEPDVKEPIISNSTSNASFTGSFSKLEPQPEPEPEPETQPEIKSRDALGFFDDLTDKKEEEVTVVRKDENENVIDTPKLTSEDDKKSDVKEDVKMFSFANLYPNIKGKGKVEEITKIDDDKKEVKSSLPSLDEDKVTEVAPEINEKVMQEVMTIDKKKDDIDETETLDNFFSEIKQLASKNDKSITVNDTKEESYTFFD